MHRSSKTSQLADQVNAVSSSTWCRFTNNFYCRSTQLTRCSFVESSTSWPLQDGWEGLKFYTKSLSWAIFCELNCSQSLSVYPPIALLWALDVTGVVRLRPFRIRRYFGNICAWEVSPNHGPASYLWSRQSITGTKRRGPPKSLGFIIFAFSPSYLSLHMLQDIGNETGACQHYMRSPSLSRVGRCTCRSLTYSTISLGVKTGRSDNVKFNKRY